VQEASILYFFDGKGELSFPGKEKDLALMCDGAWVAMGEKPFVDHQLRDECRGESLFQAKISAP
jgi:hypothetical protein